MVHRFDEVIQSRDRLREIIGKPGPRVVQKVIDKIDPICARFIAAAPFVVIGTTGADALVDLSPKGDPAGFVKVLDQHTLAVPDRLGNRRIDTFENLLVNSNVGLIFMIPGFDITLRVSGTAKLVRDAELQADMAIAGRSPQIVMVVTVTQAFMHCAKAMARSSLWQPAAWPDSSGVPSLAEAMVAHGKLAETTSDMQTIINNDFKTRMY